MSRSRRRPTLRCAMSVSWGCLLSNGWCWRFTLALPPKRLRIETLRSADPAQHASDDPVATRAGELMELAHLRAQLLIDTRPQHRACTVQAHLDVRVGD